MSTKETVPQEGEFKMKKKPGRPKKLTNKKEPVKLDLTKKEEDAVQEPSTTKVDVRELPGNGQEVGEGNTESKVTEEVKDEEKVEEVVKPKEEEKPPLEEINIGEKETELEPAVAEQIKEEIKQNPEIDLPENVEKLVEFMKETGGTLVDYVRLNADYSNVDNDTILKEYYLHTKPHLDSEEIDFIMDDKFSWDEDMDEERDIRKKKLALKEEVAKAKGYMEDLKSKYYDEIKLRPGVTQEQQKAMDFFNRYNKEQDAIKQRHTTFQKDTNNYFSNDFKGFEFSLGEKRFRYGVNNPSEVASNQSNLSDFIKTFLDDKGNVKDYQGYHKAIYAARNADTIASHFYEQGKTDAIKDMTAKSKNISGELRQSSGGEVFINGMKVKAISGANSSKLKIKTRNK
jgi:hypothetical protein